MTAAELRAAADRLDALADAATPGPWEFDAEDMDPGVWADGGASGTWVVGEWGTSEANAAYIAAMHPAVAKALAAWLRATEMRHLGGLSGCRERDTSRKPNAQGLCPACEALAVARAIDPP